MKKSSYSWLVCAACTLLMFCTIGISTTAFSVHQPYLIAVNGFTNLQASVILTVRYLFSIVTVLLADRMIGRLGPRNSAALSLLSGALGFAVYGLAQSHLIYCLGSVLVGIAQGLGGMVLVSIIIVRWFRSRQGTALGICAAGSGLASIICPPVVTAIVARVSLSAAFLIEAAFFLLCCVVVFIVIRDTPEKMGLAAYTAQKREERKVRSYGGPISTPMAVILAAIYLLVGGIMVIDTGYVSTLYAGMGHSLAGVSLLLSVNGVTLALGKVLYGMAADRRGGRWANTVFLSALLVGQILHCFAGSGSFALALAAQLLTGIGLPAGTVGVSVTAMSFSSETQFPKRVKTLQAMLNIGMLSFSFLPGMLADLSGSYLSSFYVGCGAVILYFGVLSGLYLCRKSGAES